MPRLARMVHLVHPPSSMPRIESHISIHIYIHHHAPLQVKCDKVCVLYARLYLMAAHFTLYAHTYVHLPRPAPIGPPSMPRTDSNRLSHIHIHTVHLLTTEQPLRALHAARAQLRRAGLYSFIRTYLCSLSVYTGDGTYIHACMCIDMCNPPNTDQPTPTQHPTNRCGAAGGRSSRTWWGPSRRAARGPGP